ncbi:hypothetical protein Pfo_024574 [Paulownia fortunei]|nr:hypothetical protein Pfo_024574 [Paulownia fortunei]
MVLEKKAEISATKKASYESRIAELEAKHKATEDENCHLMLSVQERELELWAKGHQLGYDQGLKVGYDKGVKDSHYGYINFSNGRKFLQIYCHEIKFSFMKSNAYLAKLALIVLEYYCYEFWYAREQAREQRFIGELDHKTPIRNALPPKGWEGNPQEAMNHPWWKSTAEMAFHIIQEA